MRANAPTAIGVAQYPHGSEYCNYALRHHTTTNLPAAEVHQRGQQFDLIEFHRVVLSSAGIPPALLDGVVDRYIADKPAAPQRRT